MQADQATAHSHDQHAALIVLSTLIIGTRTHTYFDAVANRSLALWPAGRQSRSPVYIGKHMIIRLLIPYMPQLPHIDLAHKPSRESAESVSVCAYA